MMSVRSVLSGVSLSAIGVAPICTPDKLLNCRNGTEICQRMEKTEILELSLQCSRQ